MCSTILFYDTIFFIHIRYNISNINSSFIAKFFYNNVNKFLSTIDSQTIKFVFIKFGSRKLKVQNIKNFIFRFQDKDSGFNVNLSKNKATKLLLQSDSKL